MLEWNQSPGGSPPSLDDVLEKIQLKLKGFKGGPVLILVAVVVVFIIGWTAWFTVQPEETGIVQRFGKVMRTAGPGLHFKLPFGIEKVRLLPTARILKEEVNESRQDKERTINKAQEQANREIPKARGVATQRISEAEGYALKRVNRAEEEATRFEAILNEYPAGGLHAFTDKRLSERQHSKKRLYWYKKAISYRQGPMTSSDA